MKNPMIKRSNWPVLLYLVFLVPNFVYSEENSLRLANDFYDKDMYPEAKEHFQNVIDSGNINGEILYRFAYSNEIIEGLNEGVLKIYAAAYSYFKKNNESNHRYYLSAGKKLQENAPNLLNAADADINNIIQHLQRLPNEVSTTSKIVLNSLISRLLRMGKEHITAILVLFLILFVIVYILALVLSFKTNCVIIWGWKDLIVLSLLSIDTIAMLVAVYNGTMTWASVFLVVFLILFAKTIIYSIQANITIIPHGGLYAAVSISTKILMLVIIPLIIILYSSYTSDSSYKTDRRYRDGTKGNTKTKTVTAFAAVVAFFVGTLVKNRKIKMVIDENNQVTLKRDHGL
jgi:hypothetical protein